MEKNLSFRSAWLKGSPCDEPMRERKSDVLTFQVEMVVFVKYQLVRQTLQTRKIKTGNCWLQINPRKENLSGKLLLSMTFSVFVFLIRNLLMSPLHLWDALWFCRALSTHDLIWFCEKDWASTIPISHIRKLRLTQLSPVFSARLSVTRSQAFPFPDQHHSLHMFFSNHLTTIFFIKKCSTAVGLIEISQNILIGTQNIFTHSHTHTRTPRKYIPL